MNILLVNDDGYTAEGILTLERVLREKGHTTCTVAPHTQQSAKSHAMTVHGSMTVHRYDEYHYSLEGTPADCVIYPIRSGFIPFRPDMIISGINHGYNLSSDTIYSGTCGAARQGAMYSIPSVALSAHYDENGKYDFVTPAEYTASKLEHFMNVLEGAESFLSLNFPPHWNGEVRKATLGTLNYSDEYTCSYRGDTIIIDGNGYSLDFTAPEKEYPGDRSLVLAGYATATVIAVNPASDYQRMKELEL